jgi:hypothetical protein
MAGVLVGILCGSESAALQGAGVSSGTAQTICHSTGPKKILDGFV